MRGRLWFLWNKLTREFGFWNLSSRHFVWFSTLVVLAATFTFFVPSKVSAADPHLEEKNVAIRQACANLISQSPSPLQVEDCFNPISKACTSIEKKTDFDQCVATEQSKLLQAIKSGNHPESCANAAFFTGTNFKCMSLDLLSYVLGGIVKALGKVLTFLIEIFLGFAQYNGFSDAPPVRMGWKLVRDLVNMFFIVILLVSAFATIIGYGGEDFHAAHVLPKLLLMAVLINFSKTLIQLLIDFSQVIMLTFVNAFQTGASAQLVDAFGLTTVGKEAVGGGVADFMNFIVSYLLGIVVLIVSIGVMVILIGYIIGRIVGLWMALIFSPLALFATAIPSKLQKGMGNLTTKYWGDLTGMLTGGPIIAFYLWLTIAILQSASAGGEQLSKSLKLYNPVAAVDQNGFFTQLGQSGSIAKFIIAITLLMMAMKQAVESAGAVSSSMGEFAQKVQGYTRSAAGTALAPIRFAAASPFLAARTGLRGVRAGAAAIERRADLRGKVGRLGQATVGRMPGLRGVLRQPLAAAVTVGKVEREKEIADTLAGSAKMSYQQKRDFAQSIPTGFGSSKAEKEAYAQMMQELGSEDSQFKETKSRAQKYEEALITANPTMDRGEAKRRATSRAMNEVTQEAQQHTGEARRVYTDLKMPDKTAELDKVVEKNPDLAADDAAFNRMMGSVRGDEEKEKALSADAISRARVLLGLVSPANMRRNGAGQITDIDIQGLVARHEGKPLAQNLQALKEFVQASGGVDEATLQGYLLQKGRFGTPEVYRRDPATGGTAWVPNATVQTALGALRTNAADAGAARTAVEAGASLEAVLKRAEIDAATGQVTQDATENGTVVANVAAQLQADAATPGGFTVLIKKVAKNLKKGNVTFDTKVQLMAALRAGGFVNKMQEAQWNGLSNDDQRDAFEVAKVMAAVNDAIAQRGGPANAAETQVVGMQTDWKAAMPSSVQREDPPGSGRMITVNAPEPIRKSVHNL